MKVAVFGAGTMGLGIAEVFASFGNETLMYASSIESAQRHKDSLAGKLKKRIERGKLDQATFQTIMDNIVITEKAAAADADLVIETIKEDMALKKELFAELDKMCKPEAIFASNTSALSITELGNGVNHPVIGMHFFFPVRSMKLIEVIKGAHTPDETVEKIREITKSMGKDMVQVKEAPGFVVNRIIVPYQNEGIHILEMGTASVEDIDKAMMLALNHPFGPLTLADESGLDVVLAIMETLYRETGDSKYRPTLLLKKMVRSGDLGRKTGRGFYIYQDGKKIPRTDL